MHSHLIPGIDDGAKDMADSLDLLRAMVQLGFRKVITTPHIMAEYYPNSRETILQGLAEVKAALAEAEIPVELEAAAEYMADDHFTELLQNKAPLLTLPGKRLLLEFSTFSPPRNIHELLFTLNTQGYKPILAHPERYVYYGNQLEKFETIKSMGCSFQLNLLSLTGHYGAPQKKLGIKLLKAGLIDYLGTDMHRIQHAKILTKGLKDRKIQHYLRDYIFLNSKL